MRFVRDKPAQAEKEIAAEIVRQLRAKKRLLWLVSGGSAIAIQTNVMKRVTVAVPDLLEQLLVFPVDERFGPAGHADSNFAQMEKAGFAPGSAFWFDMLAGNLAFADTVSKYSAAAEAAFGSAHIVIATLGLGTDAHTAGVLPDSPAIEVSEPTVVGYEWQDYQRMTLSLEYLRRIDQAYLLAYGSSKEEALQRLRQNQEPLSALPAKILYDIPSVTVYNDFITSEE